MESRDKIFSLTFRWSWNTILLWIIYGSLTLSFTLWKSHPPLTHVLLSHCLAPSRCIYLPPWPLKGIVHPGIKIVSSFTHPHVAPNLHDILSSVQHEEKLRNVDVAWIQWRHIVTRGFFKQTQKCTIKNNIIVVNIAVLYYHSFVVNC